MHNRSIAGINISISGPHSPVTDAVLEMFRFTSAFPHAEKVNLSVYDLKDIAALYRILPLWLGRQIESLLPAKDAQLVYGLDDALAAITNDGMSINCAMMAADKDEIRYFSCKLTDQKSPLSVSSALVPVLKELLVAHDRQLLHAASLCCPDGTGVLLLADAGGGKTTTALSMLRQGARLLSDDLTVLQGTDQYFSMAGFPELMNLTDGTINFFPELGDHLSKNKEPKSMGKHMLAARNVYGGERMLDSCRVHVVFLVKIASEGPRLLPVSISAALGNLIRAHAFARSQKISKSSFAIFSSLLSQIPTFELHTGQDPAALGKWLVRNCRSHRRDRTPAEKDE